ncbi:hypothetical protein RFI_23997 [Reticulomyxa filosa]|uniref:Uncharacterized protein n=1 Tax=Reticulomyxa filosa TaxID=46433 RepID=X6MJ00_RETFI|nr:hypothetical protein RFI_23997 [Reticulomyxa filosa]|eukprot:ETO13377.1 hypothetical protein RFI_23997 [Reticulomyxa filosa]
MFYLALHNYEKKKHKTICDAKELTTIYRKEVKIRRESFQKQTSNEEQELVEPGSKPMLDESTHSVEGEETEFQMEESFISLSYAIILFYFILFFVNKKHIISTETMNTIFFLKKKKKKKKTVRPLSANDVVDEPEMQMNNIAAMSLPVMGSTTDVNMNNAHANMAAVQTTPLTGPVPSGMHFFVDNSSVGIPRPLHAQTRDFGQVYIAAGNNGGNGSEMNMMNHSNTNSTMSTSLPTLPRQGSSSSYSSLPGLRGNVHSLTPSRLSPSPGPVLSNVNEREYVGNETNDNVVERKRKQSYNGVSPAALSSVDNIVTSPNHGSGGGSGSGGGGSKVPDMYTRGVIGSAIVNSNSTKSPRPIFTNSSSFRYGITPSHTTTSTAGGTGVMTPRTNESKDDGTSVVEQSPSAPRPLHRSSSLILTSNGHPSQSATVDMRTLQQSVVLSGIVHLFFFFFLL